MPRHITVRSVTSWAPLRSRAFQLLMIARIFVAIGAGITLVAAADLVYQASGSAMTVGVLAVLAVAPQIPGSAIGGIWVHNHCPRIASAVLFGVEAIVVLALALLAYAGLASVPVVFALTFLAAVPAGIATAVADDLIKLTAPEAQREAVGAVERVLVNGARVLGAIAGGAIVLGLGYATAFLANAVALAIFTVLILAARSLQPACDLLQAQVRDAVPHAVRQYLKPGVVRVVIASTTIFFLLVGPLSRQMPSIAAQHGDDPMYIGYLVGALALGAAIASPVVFRFSGSHYRHPILGTALVAAGPLLVLLAISRSLVLDLVVMVLIGIAGELVRKSAEFSLTREISIGSATLAGPLVTSLGAIGIAVGALLVGECFDVIGLEQSLILFGAAVVGCGVAFVWQDRVRGEVPFPGR